MLKVLVGAWGTAMAPEDTQRVGGARLAQFPDCEQQLLTTPAQHKLFLISAAADLPMWGEAGVEGRRGPGLWSASGQETEGALT